MVKYNENMILVDEKNVYTLNKETIFVPWNVISRSAFFKWSVHVTMPQKVQNMILKENKTLNDIQP